VDSFFFSFDFLSKIRLEDVICRSRESKQKPCPPYYWHIFSLFYLFLEKREKVFLLLLFFSSLYVFCCGCH
jgi:hypothetical protein